MSNSVLSYHEGLAGAGRLPTLSRAGARFSAVELSALVFLGACAGLLSGWLKLGLGIPGHNILRVMFPTALALALVPRRGTASIVGGSAGVTTTGLMLGGSTTIGFGAATSLLLTGVLIDLALLGAKNGWSVYLRLVLAGLAANTVALAVKAGSKLLATGGGAAPFATWWPKASVTYLVCGALAGLISAAVWFRFAGPHRHAESGDPQ